MQPFQCDLQAQIPKDPITTHTQAHPKQLEATVTMRQKKNDKPTPAATAAQTRYLSSSPAATLHGKTQGFVLRLPPQNIAHATSCSHYNAVRSINSQTCTYLRTEQHQNTRWQESCSHSNAICKHRFQNTLYLRRHKHTQSSLKPPLQCGKKKTTNRPQPQPPHRRGTFHRRLQPLYTEKHKVSCSSFLPKT